MGKIQNMMVLLVFCSWAVSIINPDSSTLFQDMINQQALLNSSILAMLGIAAGAAVVGGIFTQQITFGLFAGVATFLLGFFTFPIDLLNTTELPTEIKVVIGTAFGLMYLMAVLNFYKGTGEG